MELCWLPEVLVFHLKRFKLNGRKIRDHVEYPATLDMRNFQNKEDIVKGKVTKYQLVGLTEHVGRNEGSGHYTAHALREGRWYSFDDEYFERVDERAALKREAYLLFYKRIN